MLNFYKAFLKAQTEIGSALKDAVNPHFRSNYETLESVIDAVKKPLNDNGILIIHYLGFSSDKPNLTTRLIHAESGEYAESMCELILTKNDMQQMGSAQTYAKRQNLKALTNLPSEDDDGNEASKPAQKPPASKPQQQRPPLNNLPQEKSISKSDMSEWMIELGPQSKLTGSRLKDHDVNFLIEQRESLLAWYTKMGKNPHENVLKFVDALAKYIEQMK